MNNLIKTPAGITERICIARVSDVTQRKALPAQKLNLKTYVQRLGEEWNEANYFEFDESAFKDDRKKFEQLVFGFQKKSPYLIIIFDKIDRFTRDSRQAVVNNIMKLVDSGRAELHFPSDGLVVDKNSSANDLMRFDIGLVMARYYSLSTRDNVNRRFNQMLHDGEWISAAPLGYTHAVDPNNTQPRQNGKPAKKVLIVDESRRHYIEKMFDLRIARYSYKEIAKVLYGDGFRSKAGNCVTKSGIEKMLKNPFYYGWMVCRTRNFEGEHKHGAIISKHVFQLAQQAGGAKKTGYTRREFSRIARCKNCDCILTQYESKGRPYFRCNQCKDGCRNKNISARSAVKVTDEVVGDINMPDDKLPEIAKRLQKLYSVDLSNQRMNEKSARDNYETAQKALTNLGMKLAECSITQDEYDKIAPIYRQRMAESNELLRKPRTSSAQLEITESYLLDLFRRTSELYENASDGLKNRLLQFITSNFQIDGEKVHYQVTDLCRMFIVTKNEPQTLAQNEIWCGYGESDPDLNLGKVAY